MLQIPSHFGFNLDDSVPRKCKLKVEYKKALEFQHNFCIVFISAISLVVMSVLYARVIRDLFKKQNQIIEPNQQVALRTKKRITAMLITVTLIFATLWAIASAFAIVYGYTPGNVAASVISFLLLTNSSINWILYAFFSKQFRNCFQRTLCRCSKIRKFSGGCPRVKQNPTRNGVVDTRL